MAKPHSNAPLRPDKPYPDFPLTWHRAGYWCKKIRGRLHYFGTRNGTWQDALADYQRVRDDLHAGRTPREQADNDGLTIRHAMNHFLTDRMRRMEAKELTERSFNEYKATCKRFAGDFGEERLLSDIRPEDFAAYRAKLAKKWAPTTLSGEVLRVRVALNFVYEAGLIESPIRYGPGFRLPPKKTIRLHRQAKGERLFTAQELRQLINKASQPVRSMILLALNCGFGNRDCGRLEFRHLELDRGWVNLPRSKTGIERRAPLWPETSASLRDSIASRYQPAQSDHQQLVFITKYKGPWFTETGDDAISKAFRKLLDAEDVYRPGLSFYALRHQFATIGGETLDQVGVNHIMGHADNSMSATYRERIGDDRLERIAARVRQWLFSEGHRNG